MADTRQKARRAERCPTCGSRKYRIDNGLRFCRNCGAQQEGYVQYDMGDDADAGLMGVVSRRRKEKLEKERRHLSGLKGKSLYLEALQLIMRHQLLWLVRDKGHPAELDTVVRDLWAIRIAGFPEEREDETEDQASQMFSSSGLSSGAEEETDKSKRTAPHARSWDADSSPSWPAPSMVDTLALCYLGCLLLRLPTRISDFHHWANNGNIPFRAVYYKLPQEMQDRMPAELTKQLKRPTRERLSETSLHHAVFDLVCSFHLNYSMIFPAPNATTTLVHFVKVLALPIETAVVATHLSGVLGLTYEFPIQQSRVRIVDHPEIQAMALLVVAAKLCYPMEESLAALSWIEPLPRLDWNRWKNGYVTHTPEIPPAESAKFQGMTATQVAEMTPEELDDYLGHLAGLYDHNNDSGVTTFFPKPSVPDPKPPTRELSVEETLQRAKSIIQDATSNFSEPAVEQQAGAEPWARHVLYNTVDGLPDQARALFQAAADTCGTSLTELMRAVHILENRMAAWGRQQAQAESEGRTPARNRAA